MTSEATAVLRVLRATDGPMRSKRIARIVGIAWRQVIDAVRELRTKHGILVAGSNVGLWLITNEADARATRGRLIGKLRGIAEVVRAIDVRYPELVQARLLEE